MNQPTIVFIDTQVPSYLKLVDAVKSDAEVILINADRDGIDAITTALAGRKNLQSIQVISHGRAGNLQLGAAWLNLQTLQDNSDKIRSWGKALAENGDILFLGCNLAGDENGLNLIRQISELTGADVAASEDITGSSSLGGDWDLEAKVGEIETSIAVEFSALNAYDGIFAPGEGLRNSTGSITPQIDGLNGLGNTTFTGTLITEGLINQSYNFGLIADDDGDLTLGGSIIIGDGDRKPSGFLISNPQNFSQTSFPIQVGYANYGGLSSISLSWKPINSVNYEVIPTRRFFPGTAAQLPTISISPITSSVSEGGETKVSFKITANKDIPNFTNIGGSIGTTVYYKIQGGELTSTNLDLSQVYIIDNGVRRSLAENGVNLSSENSVKITQRETEIEITLKDDAIFKRGEQITITLEQGAYLRGASQSATVNIIDNEPLVSIEKLADKVEGEKNSNGTRLAVKDVARINFAFEDESQKQTAGDFALSLNISGTAVRGSFADTQKGSDYKLFYTAYRTVENASSPIGSRVKVTDPVAGQSKYSINVPVGTAYILLQAEDINDELLEPEPTETIIVELGSEKEYGINAQQKIATVNLLDNEPTVSLGSVINPSEGTGISGEVGFGATIATLEDAVIFNGTQYVAIDSNDSLNLTNTGKFTQEAWVFPQFTDNGTYGIIGYNTGNNNAYPSISLVKSSSGTTFRIDLGSRTIDVPQSQVTNFNINGWNHVAATFDGTNYKLFVNAVEVFSTPNFAGQSLPSTQQLEIGKVGNNKFKGAIDEVRLWNVARNAGEIQQSYIDQLKGDEEGLVGYWDFNRNFEDKTSNGNDGLYLQPSTFLDLNSQVFSGSFPDNLTFKWGDNYTLESWVKTSQSSPDSIDIFRIGTIASEERLGLDWRNKTIFIEKEQGQLSSRRERISFQTDTVFLNNWHHIAVTYDGQTGTRTVYLDGNKLRSQILINRPFAVNPQPSYDALIIGSKYYDPNIAANISVNEIRIWKEALTEEEIKANFQQIIPGSTESLVTYYSAANQINGSTSVKDSSIYQNDMRISGGNRIRVANSDSNLILYSPNNLPFINNPAPQIGYVEVNLDKPVEAAQGLWVNYDITGGNAIKGNDYFNSRYRKESNDIGTERDGIIIPKGESSGRIYFSAISDAIVEGDETVNIQLKHNNFDSNADGSLTNSNYAIGTSATQTITIKDNNAYQRGVVLLDSNNQLVSDLNKLVVRKASTGATNFSADFKVKLSSQPIGNVTISLSTSRGTLSLVSSSLNFTSTDWNVPRTVSLSGVTTEGIGTITATGGTTGGNYFTGNKVFNFTTNPDLRVTEGSTTDAIPVPPVVSIVSQGNVGEDSSLSGNFVVNLSAPAPKGGIDVNYAVIDVTGNATPSVDYQGIGSYALNFDGTDDYVSFGNISTLPTNGSYTIEARINPKQMGSQGNKGGIIGWGDYGTPDKVNALRLTENGIVNFWWGNDFAVTNTEISAKISNFNFLNQWHHVAVSYDSTIGTTGKVTLFIDGINIKEFTPARRQNVTKKDNLTIGRTFDSEYFDGSIRDVRVWNTARTRVEINNNKNTLLNGNETGLIANYQGQKTNDNSLTDSSGNNNQGELKNGASYVQLNTGTITIPEGETKGIISVLPIADNLVEGEETVTVTLLPVTSTDGAGYTTNSTQSSATLKIIDDDRAGIEVVNAAITGSYINFDGVNDFVSVSNSGLTTGTQKVHTLEAWVYMDQLPTTRAWLSLLGQNEGGSHHWRIGADGKMQVGVNGGSQIAGNPTLEVGQWTHLATVFDGTNLTLYINGVKFGDSVPATFNFTSSEFALGRIFPNQNPFKGKIRDVRVWNTARTEVEIRNNKDNILENDETGLVAYYKGDASNTSLINSATATGIAANGTLNGGATSQNIYGYSNSLVDIITNEPYPSDGDTVELRNAQGVSLGSIAITQALIDAGKVTITPTPKVTANDLINLKASLKEQNSLPNVGLNINNEQLKLLANDNIEIELPTISNSASFAIRLQTKPSADVTIQLNDFDITKRSLGIDGSLDKTTVTFTPQNWNTYQLVTVTGLDDLSIDGDISYKIKAEVTTTTDTAYQGKSAIIPVKNLDDEEKIEVFGTLSNTSTSNLIPTVTIGNPITVTEGTNQTATVAINLSSAPTQPLSVLFDISGGTATLNKDYRLTQGALIYSRPLGIKLLPNPLDNVDVGTNSSVIFVDLDKDGDLDAVLGSNSGLKYYRNIGGAANPSFQVQPSVNNITSPSFNPTFGDINGDGTLDLIVGNNNGQLDYYRNTSPSSTNLRFDLQLRDNLNPLNPINGIDLGSSIKTQPLLVDWNNDGKLDLVIGSNSGISYYENTGTKAAATFTSRTGTSNPFNGIDTGDSNSPFLNDWDNDRDLDLFVGKADGAVNYYENNNGAFSTRTANVNNPFSSDVANLGRQATPTFADLDGDGDLDAFVGNANGTIDYYEQFNVVTFAAGETTKNINIAINEDQIAEGNEDIKVSLYQNTGYSANYINFDGVDDYVSAPLTGLNTGGKVHTIEAWVYLEEPTAQNKSILSTNGSSNGSLFWVVDANGTMRIGVLGFGSEISYTNFQKSQWTHLATVFDGTKLTLYANGQQVGQANANSSDLTLGNLTLGNQLLSWTNFKGKIRDVRVWNTARTEAQIQSNTNILLNGNEGGLVANYKGDAANPTSLINSATATGNAANGILNNGATSNAVSQNSNYQLGTPQTYVQFDGVDDYTGFNNISTLPTISILPTDGNYTLEAWINPTQMGSKGIIGWGEYGANNKVNALRLTDDGIVNYWWGNDFTVTNAEISTKIGNFSFVNQWHHVAVSYDSTSSKVTIFIDGMFIKEVTSTVAHDVTKTDNLTIGQTNTTERFNGKIRDVRVWNTVRTQAEINNNKDNNFINSTETGLVAYYKGDSANGSLIDSSVNQLNGQLLNGAVSKSDNATTINITDNDTAGVIITKISGTNTSETGDLVSYNVKLTSQPSAPVTVYLGSQDETEGLLAKSVSSGEYINVVSLEFTPNNWDQSQTFFVKGVDDRIDDDDISYKIISTPSSEDLKYNKLPVTPITLSNTDNDTVGFTIRGAGRAVEGRENVYGIKLNSQPVGDIRVIMTPTNSQIRLNNEFIGQPHTLTFTPDNWNFEQTVRATALDDAVVEYLHFSKIEFKVETGQKLDFESKSDNDRPKSTFIVNTTNSEVGNVSSTASDLGTVNGSYTWNNLQITGSTDQDWFKFVLDDTGNENNFAQISFTVDSTNPNGDLSLSLYSASDLVNAIETSNSSNSLEKISLNEKPAGTYYLKVATSNTTTNTTNYNLLVSNLSEAEAIDLGEIKGGYTGKNLAIEPVFKEGSTSGSTVLVSDDVDWFKFTIPDTANNLNFVEIKFEHNKGDLKLELYSASNLTTPISTSNTSSSNTSSSSYNKERISLGGQVAGEYYLKVSGVDNTISNQYDLLIADEDNQFVQNPLTPLQNPLTPLNVIIEDNDLPTARIIAGPTASEVFGQPSYFTIQLNAPAPLSDNGIDVRYSVMRGTATLDEDTNANGTLDVGEDKNGNNQLDIGDYRVQKEGSIRIAPGDIQNNLLIVPIDDKLVEDTTSLKFDGNDFATVSLTGLIPSTGEPVHTIEAWVYWERPTTGQSSWLLTLGGVTAGSEYWAVQENGTFISAVTGSTFATTTLSENTWTHLATVYDGAKLSLYKNGLNVKETIADFNFNNSELNLGKNPNGEPNFTGKIRDVRVWNTARPLFDISGKGNDISSNKDKILQGSELGLIANYRDAVKEEAGTQKLTDLSGKDTVQTIDSEVGNNPSTFSDLGAIKGSYTWNNLQITNSTDQDWFRFNLPYTGKEDDFAQISFTHTSGDLTLALYSESNLNTAIATSNSSDSTNNQERISLNGKPAGTYYLTVATASTTPTSYNLLVSSPANDATINPITALNFDGVDDSVSASSLTGLTTGNTVHTLESWIYLDQLPTTRAWLSLLGQVGGGSHHWLIGADGKMQVGVFGGSPGVSQIAGNPTLEVGQWTHLATVFDGTNLTLYINGVKFGDSVPATFNFTSTELALGKIIDNPFKGKIRDVRVWNTARTEAQIESSKDAVLLGNESGLVAYYKGNITGTTLTNSSSTTGSANNAILNGGLGVVQVSQGSLELEKTQSETVIVELISGGGYQLSQNTKTATLEIQDDDVPGVRIVQVGDNTVVKEGEIATFEISLLSESRLPVTITLTPGAEIEFVNPNGQTVQVDKDVYEFDTASATSSSSQYLQYFKEFVDIKLNSLVTTDLGKTISFDVQLRSQPSCLHISFDDGVSNDNNVVSETIEFGASEGTWDQVRQVVLTNLDRDSNDDYKIKATIDGQDIFIPISHTIEQVEKKTTTITIQPQDWYKLQTITIKGSEDGVSEPGLYHESNINYTITSGDSSYNGIFVTQQRIDVLDRILNPEDTANAVQDGLTLLQQSLESLEIPLIGSLKGKLPPIISDITNALAIAISAASDLTGAKLSKLINDALKPLGLDFLNVTVETSLESIAILLEVKEEYKLFSLSLDADLGLDALGIGLKTEGELKSNFDFEVALGFGLHRDFGFYIDTEQTKVEAELKLNLKDFKAEGNLGFLRLDLKDDVDNKAANGNSLPDKDNPTELAISFKAGINDLDNYQTVQFLDVDGDGLLDVKDAFNYGIKKDGDKNGKADDLNADGTPDTESKSIKEPLTNIGENGQAEDFPKVSAVSDEAKRVNWNNYGDSNNTFTEESTITNEGIYRTKTGGGFYFDLNRNGTQNTLLENLFSVEANSVKWVKDGKVKEFRIEKKKVGSKIQYYFDKDGDSQLEDNEKITEKQKKKFDKNNNLKLDADVTIEGEGTFVQGAGIAFKDLNKNGKLDAAEYSTVVNSKFGDLTISDDAISTIEYWDINNNNVLDESIDFRVRTNDDEIRYLDLNRNGEMDENEPQSAEEEEPFVLSNDNITTLGKTITNDTSNPSHPNGRYLDWDSDGIFDIGEPYSCDLEEPFAVNLSSAVEFIDLNKNNTPDSGEYVLITRTNSDNSLYLDLNGNNTKDANEPVSILSDGSRYLDLNGNSTREASEPWSKSEDEPLSLGKTESTMIAGTTYNVKIVERVQFVDLDGNGKLTVDGDDNPLEPTAAPNNDFGKDGSIPIRYNPTYTKFLDDGDRLTLTELRNFKNDEDLEFSDLFKYEFAGNANLGLQAVTSIKGDPAFPSIAFDLAVGLPLFNYGNQEDSGGEEFSVEFNDITLDFGTFLTKFAKPIVDTVDEIISPIKPVLAILNTDTKIFSLLGLEDQFNRDNIKGVSILDLGQVLADLIPANTTDLKLKRIKDSIPKVIKFVGVVQQIVDTVDSLKALTASDSPLILELGSYSLDDLKAASDDPADVSSKVNAGQKGTKVPAKDATGSAKPTPIDQTKNATPAQKSAFSKLRNLEGLEIPLLSDPSTLIRILLGEPDVDLIKYDIPDLDLFFQGQQEVPLPIPVIGPLVKAIIGLGFEVKTDLAVGYDTNGLEAWRDSDFDIDKIYKVLDGFYLNDWNSNGTEKDELTATASITAGLSASLVLIKALLQGGITGTLGFDLVDVGELQGKSDGKIRGSEIISRIKTPLQLFNLKGQIDASLYGAVKVGFDAGVFEIMQTIWSISKGPVTIAKFNVGASGISLSFGAASGSYINGATVFFDSNFNGIWDFGDETNPAEPIAFTNEYGQYELPIGLEWDRNGDGAIDYNDGQIISVGGYDTSSGTTAGRFIGLPGSKIITPLTSIQSSLVLEYGLTPDAAEGLIEAQLGIDPTFNIESFDPLNAVGQSILDVAQQSNNLGLDIYLDHIKVQALFNQARAFVDGLQGENADPNNMQLVQSAFAKFLLERSQTNNQPIDLNSQSAIASFYTFLVRERKLIATTEQSDIISQFLIRGNKVLAKVAEIGASKSLQETLPALASVKRVIQADIPVIIKDFFANKISKEKALANFDKTINQNYTLVSDDINSFGNRSVKVTSSNVNISEDSTEKPKFIVELSHPAPNQGLTVIYSVSGTSTLGEDYKFTDNKVGEIYIAPGETKGFIKLSLIDDAIVENLETITIKLTEAGEGYLINPNSSVGLLSIIDNEVNNPNLNLTGTSVKGTFGNDNLTGSAGSDLLEGLYGNDTIYGLDGDDFIQGGHSKDILYGGAGNDRLEGNFGDDTIEGNEGNDFLDGGSGDDRLYGGSDFDIILGGTGDDILEGNSGNDQLEGGDGSDHLYGNENNDWLLGDDGNDLLVGGQGDDIINGGRGKDVFFFGSSNEGFDTILDFNPNEGDVIQISRSGFGVDNLDGFRFISGILDFQGKNLALIQNNGQTYSYFPDLSKIIKIVDEPAILGETNTSESRNIFGTIKNDILKSKIGADIFKGGLGKDIFFFSSPDLGLDTILDFNLNEGDQIQISRTGFSIQNFDDFSFQNGILSFRTKPLVSLSDTSVNSSNFKDILKLVDEPTTIIGTAENDIIQSTENQETVTGGLGKDTFFFSSPDDGFMTILDFNPDEGDRIQISRSGFGVNNLDDFRFRDGILYFQQKPYYIASLQNNGQSYNDFPNLDAIVQIVDEPTVISTTNSGDTNSIANQTGASTVINKAVTNNLQPDSTTILDDIVNRGYLKVASYFDIFDRAFTRTLATALFGDPSKVEYVEYEKYADSFKLIADGDVDLNIDRITHNLVRETNFRIDFTPLFFYDTQAVIIHKDSNVDNILGLNGKTIGLVKGSTSYDNLKNTFASLPRDANGELFGFIPKYYDNSDDAGLGYLKGEVDAFSTDRNLIVDYLKKSQESSDKSLFKYDPTLENQTLIDVEFSKEPIGAAIRENDSTWADFVRWINYIPIQAEEFGINSQNVEEIYADNIDGNPFNDSSPAIRRFLGIQDNIYQDNIYQDFLKYNIKPDFVVKIIKEVGNYGELFNGYFPDLERDRNDLWSNGGLLYSPPFSGTPADIKLIDNSDRNVLTEVLKRGKLVIGTGNTNAGFAIPDKNGKLVGFDIDLSKALAAAIFGDSEAVEFVKQTNLERFTNVANGIVDITVDQATNNLVRDTQFGVDFIATYLYTGQGVLTRKDSGIFNIATLNGRKIGAVVDTTSIQNLKDALVKYGAAAEFILFEDEVQMFAAYEKGEVEAVTNDTPLLGSAIKTRKDPEKHYLLNANISKEPLAMVIDENQSDWGDVVRWVYNSLLQAEEYGITQANIDKILADNSDNNPDNNSAVATRILLGFEGDIGKKLGIPNNFVAKAIKAVGNYGEIYQRHFDPVIIPRGFNELSTEFGLQIPYPLGISVNAPTLENAIADQTTTESQDFSFTFDVNTFNDIDTGDSLTYTATLKNGNDLPPWLKFNAITRTFSGKPTKSDLGNLEINVRATDNSGAIVTDTFLLNVKPINLESSVTLSKISDDVFNITNSIAKSRLQVSLIGQNSNFINDLAVFTVDDAQGRINGIAPTETGYTQAALSRAKNIFSAIANLPNGFDPKSLSRSLEFNSGDNLRFLLIKNDTLDNVRKKNVSNPDILFSNASNQKITDSGTGKFTLAWKDGSGNSSDFIDFVVNIQPTDTPLPLGTNLQDQQQGEVFDLRNVDLTKTVQANFVVNREASYNNFVGFYKITDSQGTITDPLTGVSLKPGDIGYTESAIKNRVAGIDLQAANQSTATINGVFQGGSIFAPFIVVNGSPDQLLDNNKSNDPAVYFAYLGANSDGVDHIRLLANNTFGFEDLPSGGDFDYNDIIIKANLSVA